MKPLLWECLEPTVSNIFFVYLSQWQRLAGWRLPLLMIPLISEKKCLSFWTTSFFNFLSKRSCSASFICQLSKFADGKKNLLITSNSTFFMHEKKLPAFVCSFCLKYLRVWHCYQGIKGKYANLLPQQFLIPEAV